MSDQRRLRERLKEIDPNLKINPGGIRHRAQPRTSRSDWDKAGGVICNGCGKEVFRSRGGLCMGCWEKANELEIRGQKELLEFLPESVIMEICRPARGE